MSQPSKGTPKKEEDSFGGKDQSIDKVNQNDKSISLTTEDKKDSKDSTQLPSSDATIVL